MVMASKSVASALTLLTSEAFTFIPSDSPDNDKLEALVSDIYFTGNDEITDYEESDSDDGIFFPNVCSITIFPKVKKQYLLLHTPK